LTRIVLASASPRRRELLQRLGLEFEVVPSRAGERAAPGAAPEEAVLLLARAKAEDVASHLGEGLVIGADTAVILGDELLGKPRDREDARAMLEALSGRAHRVLTGVAVVDAATGRLACGVEETTVYVRRLSAEEIDSYVATGEPMDKAGAYGIQGRGSVLVRGIEGCYFNVVGLPLARLACMLEDFGVRVLGGRQNDRDGRAPGGGCRSVPPHAEGPSGRGSSPGKASEVRRGGVVQRRTARDPHPDGNED